MEVLVALLLLSMIPFFWLCSSTETVLGSTQAMSEAAIMLALIPVWVVAMYTWLTVGWPVFSLVMTRSKDELLGAIPVLPKQQLRAYLLTSALLVGFFSVLLVPFYVAVLFFHSVSPWLFWTVMAPPAVCLNGILFMFLSLSFVARATKTWEVIVLFFVINYVGAYAVQIPMSIGFIVWTISFGHHDLQEHTSLVVILAACLLPMLISLAYLAYRLSLYQFSRKSMSPWSGAAWSILGYGIWSTLWTVIALAVSIVYFSTITH